MRRLAEVSGPVPVEYPTTGRLGASEPRSLGTGLPVLNWRGTMACRRRLASIISMRDEFCIIDRAGLT
jgi:hypothetical protein